MKENFPNFGEGNRHASPRSTESEIKWTKRRTPRHMDPRHIIIKMPKVKDKERILKAA